MAAPTPATFMLLDTYGLVYRAFFALPSLTTTRGVPINAAYGFTMMLNKLLADERPTHVIAAFDKGMPADRVAMFEAYKAQREAMPDELRSQFALVRDVLTTFGIPIVEMEGQEADDVIATLAAQIEREGERALIVTGDLDLLQLVDDNVTVLTTRRGITELGRYDPAAVRERFGLQPAQLPDFRGLKGDPSDNLPGIPGVGEKTATKLLHAGGSLDALVADPALAGSEKLTRLLREYGAQAQLCRDVSVVRRDLPLALDRDASRYRAPSDAELYRLYSQLEFKTLLAKLAPPAEMTLFAESAALEGRYRSYVASVDPPEFERLARELHGLAAGDVVAFALDDASLGASGAAGSGLAFARAALAHEPVRAALSALFSSNVRVAGYDVKRLWRAFSEAGIDARFDDDAMLAAHLLDPSRTYARIEEAAAAHLQLHVGEDVAAHADAALRILAATRGLLDERAQLRLYADVEVPLAPLLGAMEAAGIAVDLHELDHLRAEIEAATERVQAEIFAHAGGPFNLASPQQLGSLLFEQLGLAGGKRNKTGWATGAEVLHVVAKQHPIGQLVVEWRELTKLRNTYIDVIPQLVDPRDRRLHTIFNQTSTATGRLSSTNPNLQNIPVRTELGRRIRRAFVAKSDEFVFLAADYSQIELRLMAHLSGDEAMRSAFEAGHDVHDFTARRIFGIADDVPVSADQRRMAKSVNFGLLYGMSDFGLAQRLEIDRAEARAITDAYFARFPSVRAYIERTLADARRNGFVTTILGRRRYMPALTSPNYMLRSAAEREATNAPLQGSAADLMKLAMVHVERAIRARGLAATMLLQIHDELIFEVRADQRDDVAALVRAEMESALELSVPLEVTLKSGRTWYDVETIKEDEPERV